MSTKTLSNEEILEAIGGKTVVELADLIEAFKVKFNVTVMAAASLVILGRRDRRSCFCRLPMRRTASRPTSARRRGRPV